MRTRRRARAARVCARGSRSARRARAGSRSRSCPPTPSRAAEVRPAMACADPLRATSLRRSRPRERGPSGSKSTPMASPPATTLRPASREQGRPAEVLAQDPRAGTVQAYEERDQMLGAWTVRSYSSKRSIARARAVAPPPTSGEEPDEHVLQERRPRRALLELGAVAAQVELLGVARAPAARSGSRRSASAPSRSGWKHPVLRFQVVPWVKGLTRRCRQSRHSTRRAGGASSWVVMAER
jgi:hypothetical protein